MVHKNLMEEYEKASGRKEEDDEVPDFYPTVPEILWIATKISIGTILGLSIAFFVLKILKII